jgi:hypothetical protein
MSVSRSLIIIAICSLPLHLHIRFSRDLSKASHCSSSKDLNLDKALRSGMTSSQGFHPDTLPLDRAIILNLGLTLKVHSLLIMLSKSLNMTLQNSLSVSKVGDYFFNVPSYTGWTSFYFLQMRMIFPSLQSQVG